MSTDPRTPTKKRSWQDEAENPAKRPRLDSSDDSALKLSQASTRVSIEPFVVAESPVHQHVWDKLPPWALYELARLAALDDINLDDIPASRLQKLVSVRPLSMQHIVEALQLRRRKPVLDAEAARILDFEMASHLKGDGSNLEYEQNSAELSGRVHFTAALSMQALVEQSSSAISPLSPRKSPRKETESDIPTPILSLRKPQVGGSCLFARVLGSQRLLRVKILDRLFYQNSASIQLLFDWALRPIYILGRFFRAFVEKDSTIWYLLVDKSSKSQLPDVESLINWWIPLDDNKTQLMCKLVTRLHLGVSGTRPGPPVFDSVKRIDDIPVPGTDLVFTDGCGLVSSTLATKIWKKCAQNKNLPPSAYQIRLGTSKGMVQVFSPEENNSDSDSVHITGSMIKAKHLSPRRDGPVSGMHLLDAALYLLCVVKPASCRSPARLSFQLIPILFQQGVPLEVFVELQQRSVDKIIADLTIPSIDEERRRMSFAKAIQRHANLIYATLMESGYLQEDNSRARFSEKTQRHQWGIEDLIAATDEEDGNLNHAELIMARYAQLYLATVSGLNIKGSAFFMKAWRALLTKAINTATLSFRIEVPGSLYCTIVPDFSGQLDVGQISFTPPDNMPSLGSVNFKSGSILVGRHPAYLPTDIQKVELADVPALRATKGVIFFPTIGHRPLADLLAGGDYDGDEVILIWEPSIVEQFENADESLADKPAEVVEAFERESITVEAIVDSFSGLDPYDSGNALVERLLGSLKVAPLLSKYNDFYLRAVHEHGIASNEARDMAFKFNTLMDAPKTSLVLKPEVRKEDALKWTSKADPLWKQMKDEFVRGRKQDVRNSTISSNTGRVNVLNELFEAGKAHHERVWSEAIGKDGGIAEYDQKQREKLFSEWTKAETLATKDPALQHELKLVKDVVSTAQKRFREIQAAFSGTRRTPKDVAKRNKALTELAYWFNNQPTPEQVPSITGRLNDGPLQIVRASCAYMMDCQEPTGYIHCDHEGGFPWLMGIKPLLSLLSSNTISLEYNSFAKLTPHSSFCSGIGDDNEHSHE